MRVRTFHQDQVQRSSTLLHGLLTAHSFFSLFFSTPVWFASLAVRYHMSLLTTAETTWVTVALVVWFCAEATRVVLGKLANLRMLFGELIGFIVLCAVPQLLIVLVLFVAMPKVSSIERSVSILQVVLLVLEFLTAIRLLLRLSRNQIVNFYVALGSPHATER